MLRIRPLVVVLAVLVLALTAACSQGSDTAGPVVTVYKSPTCDCCTAWVAHLRNNGFDVVPKNVEYQALSDVKSEYGLPADLASCHTATVDGYVIEGHVPADVITQLLNEQPEVTGLAVPGMPVGSPGMEGPNPQPYDVVAFSEGGQTWVYAHR